MSELRKRKGGEAASSSSSDVANFESTPMRSVEATPEMNGQLEVFLREYLDPNAGRKPGLSNEAKYAKQECEKDPYKPDLLWKLADCYAMDKQWKECANVLCRALPRAKELPDDIQQELYWTLVTAALKMKNHDLAYAGLQNIVQPEEDDDRRNGYLVMQCQVLSAKGDVTGGLKAFKTAIEGAPYDTCLAAYLWCAPYLRMIGAKDVAENAVTERFGSAADGTSLEEEKERWEAVKRVVDLKEAVDTPINNTKTIVIVIVFVLVAVVLFVAGWNAISSSVVKKKQPSLPLDDDE